MDLERYLEGFKEERDAAGFVLDFDGTLAPIVARPSEAAPLPAVPRLLESLAERYRTVTVLSGRRAGDVQRMVAAQGVRYLGIYGAEELAGGRLHQSLEAERWREAAARLAAGAREFLKDGGPAGCTVEYKDLAVSIHHRDAPDPEAGWRVLEWARANTPSGFVCEPGRMVVELRPAAGSKGVALERIINQHGLRWVVAAGDDSSDLDALRRARELLGLRALRIAVHSEEGPPDLAGDADVLVASPQEVVEVLRRFL